MVHSVDVQGQFVRTETSSGSNSAPAQPEKTNEQSNVRSAVIALVAGAVGLSPTILWAMPQPGTCAGYYPISPKIWLACDTSNYSKRTALGCSVAKPCLRLHNGDGSSNRRQSDSCCRSHARDCKGEFGLCLCVLGQVQGCLCECPGATRGL